MESRAELLAAYDAQLREDAEIDRADEAVRHHPLRWARFGTSGFVTYRDLGGASGAALEALIDDTVAHFRDDTDVRRFEWKARGHDAPSDLGDRLVARGLVPGEVETVMIGEAVAMAVDVALPDGVVVRRAGSGADLRADVRRAGAMQSLVFANDSGPADDDLAEEIMADPEGIELWLAEADGEVICAGRLDVVVGTEFAGLWGGATRADWRGRGIYRALTAARARSALGRGLRLLQSDCTDMSRPILERSGFVAVTTTTPYVWTRGA